MSDLIRQTFDATGQAQLPSGRFLLIIESGAPMTLVFVFDRGTKKVTNIGAGYKTERVQELEAWREVNLTGTPGASFAIFVGEDNEDYLGTVQLTALQRSTTIPTAADVAIPVGAVAVFAANAARKRAFLCNVGTENIRVGDVNVTAARGAQVQPGQCITIESTAQIFAIREGAVDGLAARLEEVF